MNFVKLLAPLVVQNKHHNTEDKGKGQEVIQKAKVKQIILKIYSFGVEHYLLKIKEYLSNYWRTGCAFILLQRIILILSIVLPLLLGPERPLMI